MLVGAKLELNRNKQRLLKIPRSWNYICEVCEGAGLGCTLAGLKLELCNSVRQFRAALGTWETVSFKLSGF